MPNMKLFGKQIEKLQQEFRSAMTDCFFGRGSWKFADTRYYRIIAALSMANDPAYADLEELPEDVDFETELSRRQRKLEADLAVRDTNLVRLSILCPPRSMWKDENRPEFLPIEEIQANYDRKLKEAQEKVLPQYVERYRSGVEGEEPNLSAFGGIIQDEGNKLERDALKPLENGRNLTGGEIEKIGEKLTAWMGYIQLANDPQYKDLKDPPKDPEELLKKTDAFKFRKSPVYAEIFQKDNDDAIWYIFTGKSERRTKGKPKLLPYEQVKKNYNRVVKNFEVDLLKKRMKALFDKVENSKGEERSDAIANIIVLKEFITSKGEHDPLDEKAIQKHAKEKLKDESFLAVIDSKELNDALARKSAQDLDEKLKSLQAKYQKEQEAKRAREEEAERKRKEREYARGERAESQRRNALSDEEVAGLRMDQLAVKLCSEVLSIYNPMSEEYTDEQLQGLLKAEEHFNNCSSGNNPEAEFKEGIEATKRFLDTKLPNSDKTIGEYAREEVLIADNFDKLMGRAGVVIEKEMRRQTAAKWIEDFKKEFRDHPEQVKQEPDYPKARIAWIMAARELSNSVRGKASTLNKVISEVEIKARAAKIMENEEFNKFTDELSEGEDLRKVEAVFTKRFSHGGELDDMFRAHLVSRPAGKLENDPNLKRWMPTVRQRIEWLQKDFAQGGLPYKPAAEILMLRQAAGVQRGGKGLDAPIPVQGERNGKKVPSLSASVESYSDNDDFRAAINKPDVQKQIVAGHGGAMVENYEKQPEAKQVKQELEPGLGK